MRFEKILKRKQRSASPIPRKQCAICGKQGDYVYPITLDLCPTCARRFIERSGGETIKVRNEKINYNGRCYWCGRKISVLYNSNLYVCERCAKKIPRRVRGED